MASLAGLTDLVLPRSVALGGLATLASALAQAGEAAASVAVLLGDTAAPSPVTGRPSAAERQAVPEPGTLACVLAALVVLLLVRRRRR